MKPAVPDAGLSDAAITARLRECGVRMTAQRLRIARVLLAAPRHLDAEQVAAALHASGSRISKATIYNTLNLFVQRGLLRPLAVGLSKTSFDSNVSAHFHFHDEHSGALIDLPLPEVEFARLPAPPPGMEVAGIDLVIRLRKQPWVEAECAAPADPKPE
jgi:Fur family iron response transcriptional regulator